ncbi:hypothetical protein WOLCODRAFT_137063 [Wolfiporia cocos MD-104 SS10]|uniref:Up-regulated during septation protein 1 domain-containing protein n=1 Tax=Wolfiporia cocos (strain MD-104) TaxID=742152 RepID=A0A2H3JFA3_WOLCO|nr:hypothetical protein WOLCODRAFT_137063 [Wolfiporia cocos MD-104 SS10]
MNGVRRFLTGGGTPTAQTFATSQDPSLPNDAQSPPSSTAPLSMPARPSWPPSPLQSPTELSPVGSPKATTTALLFRKDRQRPADDAAHTSTHSAQSSLDMNRSPARGQAASAQSSPPAAGPSSPRPLRVSELTMRPSVDRGDPEPARAAAARPTRDELLMSLLASEAIVDSRGLKILSAEEVEELKKEGQVLAARLTATSKKLSLETKIRDAALSLSRANAAYKNVSRQTAEQLDAANRKVELAQKELWRVSERANEVQRRLLEHRAGVLSYSVRSLEGKAAPGDGESSASGFSTPNRDSQLSSTPSTTTSFTTASSRGKFEHFFAGHSDAVVPQAPRFPPTAAEVATLEDKLKATAAALEATTTKQAEISRELSVLRLEKDQIETSLGMDLQAAEETIASLEQELSRAGDANAQLRALEEERDGWTADKEEWERDRAELEERRRDMDILERRLAVLEEQSGETVQLEGVFAAEREEARARLEAKERELAEARALWEGERAAWDAEKATLQSGAEGKAQLVECTDALRELMHTHGILLSSRDASLSGLVFSVGKHIEDLHAKVDAHTRAEEEWIALRTKMEADIRTGLDKREALYEEVEEARRARDSAISQVRDLEAQLREQSLAQMAAVSLQGPVEYTGDAAAIVAILQPIWAVLPSPEARANKLSSRSFRAGTPGSPSPNRNNSSSLSEMDVRTLKTLYDPRSLPPPAAGTFTVEAFAARVQALVADDRALIERLVRFAQAHDLLKKNAERAQKLAQETNVALETYQKQVKMLEDRNIAMLSKQTALEDEAQRLQEFVDRITKEKLELENQATAQANTCRELTDANNKLSAGALTLADDAAASVRKQMEAQLAERNAAFARATEEIEALRSSQQTQQMALLEELNSMQTENANLRAQLRKR